MANITLKNIPDELYQRLKAEAKKNHRSLNGEIINRLEKSGLRPTKKEIQANAEYTRSFFKEKVSEEFITYAKNFDRE